MNKMTKGFTLVELLVVIGILGILMGVLFPTINTAMQNAKTNSCCIQGRKLFTEIVQADISREQKGMASVWPRTSETKTDDTDDIAGATYGTATEYFKKLFDIEHYGSEECDPYVGCDMSVLSGYGVPPFAGQNFQGDNVLWNIAQGIESDLPEVVPVLVSRNADTSQFALSGQNDMSSQKTRISLGKTFPQPFGNKGCVILFKGGGAKTFLAHDCRLTDIYNANSFTIPDGITMKYLEP